MAVKPPLRPEDSPWMLMDIDWSALTDGRRPRTYSKGHVFYEQDEVSDNVFIVEKGRVALRIFTTEGDARTIITLDEGCIFGNLSLFDDKANSCRAISVSDEVSVYTIPKGYVIAKINEEPELMHNMLLESNRVNRILTKQMELLTFRNAECIVCFYLMHMANLYSEEVDSDESGRKRITMKFTHQDIADVTGLSRVCVSNVISSLMKNGVLEKADKGCMMCDPVALEERVRL
jgi:CRP/FNR family transcriptional regulator